MDGKLVDAEIPKYELFAFCGIAQPQLFFDSIRFKRYMLYNSGPAHKT